MPAAIGIHDRPARDRLPFEGTGALRQERRAVDQIKRIQLRPERENCGPANDQLFQESPGGSRRED